MGTEATVNRAVLQLNNKAASETSDPNADKAWLEVVTDGLVLHLEDGTEKTFLASGEAAPVAAKYIVQTADSTLTNEQALGALSTGLLKNTTTTGVLSTAVAGTDYLSPAGSETVTNKTVDADNNTITNIGAAEVKADLITGLTADASPVGSTDYVMTYDASATALKKVLLDDLPGGGGGGATAFTGLSDVPASYSGQALKGVRVNAAETALEFATISGGSGAMTQIAKTTLGSNTTTVTFSAISGSYSELAISYITRGSASALFGEMRMRFNSDTGSNYDHQSWIVQNNTRGGAGVAGASFIFIAYITAANTAANVPGTGRIFIPHYANTTFYKQAQMQGLYSDNAGYASTSQIIIQQGGRWRNTAAITSIDLFLASGDFIAGSEFTLWGIT